MIITIISFNGTANIMKSLTVTPFIKQTWKWCEACQHTGNRWWLRAKIWTDPFQLIMHNLICQSMEASVKENWWEVIGNESFRSSINNKFDYSTAGKKIVWNGSSVFWFSVWNHRFVLFCFPKWPRIQRILICFYSFWWKSAFFWGQNISIIINI